MATSIANEIMVVQIAKQRVLVCLRFEGKIAQVRKSMEEATKDATESAEKYLSLLAISSEVKSNEGQGGEQAPPSTAVWSRGPEAATSGDGQCSTALALVG